MTSVRKNVKKLEPSYTIDSNVKWCSLCEKQYSLGKKFATPHLWVHIYTDSLGKQQM